MSLLADKDFLLQSLRLNYIRHVLPNHAAQSSLPGTGPYNLIAFDLSSPTLNSPYVQLAGLADEAKWPELSSGRSSPPLGLVHGRGDANATGGRRRPGGTGGGLQYSQTIVAKGGGVGGAGMRVGGRQRSWKGRGAALSDTGDESGSGDGLPEEVQEASTEVLNRRNSLETSIHRRRIDADRSNVLQPPPVIIHSPVRTPQDSPVGGVHPDGPTTPGTPDSPSDTRTQLAQRLAPGFELSPAEAAAQDEDYRLYDNPPVSPSIDESPLDYPSRSLSNISENAELDTSFSIPPTLVSSVLQSAASTPADAILASSLASSRSLSSDTDPNEASSDNAAGRFASVASSGISLFGVSRLNGTSDGVILGRERSDSDSSSLVVPASDKQIGRIEEEEEDILQAPPLPLLVAGRNYRATRERRRVNISGRMLVPISEPSNEEDTPPASAAAGSHPSTAANGHEMGRPRSNTDPNTLAVPLRLISGRDTAIVGGKYLDGAVEDDSEKRLRRKVSAPSLLLLSASTTSAPPIRAEVPPTVPTSLPKPTTLSLPPTPTRSHHNSLTFPSRGTSSFVRPPLPQRSALTALLSAKSDSPSASNPFSTLYAALASRATDALTLSLYFPHSKTPAKKLKVGVKKDLSVEEVIGAGLWAYWEEGREPKLEVGTTGETDETTKWNLRIVEDDGEVDEDFPALDRTRAISAFSFDEFAIVKATPPQVKDNEAKQAQIQRRPSRVLAAPKRNLVVADTLAPPPPPPVPAPAPSMMLGPPPIAPGGSFRPGTMGVSSALAIPVLLRVRLPPAPGVEGINTTINVPNDMYMSDVLDHICKKRGLENPKDWALMVQHNGREIIVPLDRTVDSLGDRHNLVLVRRDQVASLRGGKQKPTIQNTNPSASIFKRLSEPPQPKYQSATDLTSTYQRYNVQRKLPMPLGRHARTIAVDGDYIHFMPSDNKGMFDGGRTSSYHISNVRECRVSKRAPATFKLLVQKDRVEKRYDFEADTAKAANEIVAHIQALRTTYAEEEKRAGRRTKSTPAPAAPTAPRVHLLNLACKRFDSKPFAPFPGEVFALPSPYTRLTSSTRSSSTRSHRYVKLDGTTEKDQHQFVVTNFSKGFDFRQGKGTRPFGEIEGYQFRSISQGSLNLSSTSSFPPLLVSNFYIPVYARPAPSPLPTPITSLEARPGAAAETSVFLVAEYVVFRFWLEDTFAVVSFMLPAWPSLALLNPLTSLLYRPLAAPLALGIYDLVSVTQHSLSLYRQLTPTNAIKKTISRLEALLSRLPSSSSEGSIPGTVRTGGTTTSESIQGPREDEGEVQVEVGRVGEETSGEDRREGMSMRGEDGRRSR